MRFALHWYAHRADCSDDRTPTYRGPHALVCATCMADFVVRCGICRTEARELGVADGFRHLSFSGLCHGCVTSVRAHGPWRPRRAAALAARVRTLAHRYPALEIERAPSGKRVVMSGSIGDRHVRFTLRTGAREGEYERYVFRVELLKSREIGAIDPTAIAFPESFVPTPSHRSTKIVRDDYLWLRIAFLHLGRTDTLTVVDAMLAAAASLDAAQ